MKIILAITLLALGQAHAVPYLYTYTGDHYSADSVFTTSGQTHPGFTLQDHVTASFILDSSFWGKDGNLEDGGLRLATVSSGPYTLEEGGLVTTDDFGTPIEWRIGTAQRA
jgi:hypothetical protein